MKTLFSLIIISSFAIVGLAQDLGPDRGFEAGVRYNHGFVLGGFVQVREWELAGHKMNLRDLGTVHYPAVQVELTRTFSRARRFSLRYDQFFFQGEAIVDHDINYNGTIINGRNGIDVSSTTYHRITALYDGFISEGQKYDLGYTVGLVYDRINFHIDGEVTSYSPRNEVYENFGKQAFPYPFLGVYLDYAVAASKKIKFRTGGTYIPEFKSFFKEGGNVYLQYGALYADLCYEQKFNRWRMSLGGNFGYMDLFQESKEDTNSIKMITAGPYVKVDYVF